MSKCTCNDPTCHAPWCPAGQEYVDELNNYINNKNKKKTKVLCEHYLTWLNTYSGPSDSDFDTWWEQEGRDIYNVLVD